MTQSSVEAMQLEKEEHRKLSVELSEEEWHLIAEAGERCDLSPAAFLLEASVAAARRIVPADCQPIDLEAPMPGLFAEGESYES